MKCISCGGEVASNETQCPYCGTLNKTAVEHKKRMFSKILDNIKLKEKVLDTSKAYIWNKIINRVLLILILLFLLQVAANFMIYMFIEHSITAKRIPDDMIRQLDITYEQRNINKLYSLINEYNLKGETYHKYIQMGLLNAEFEDFLSNRNDYIEEIELTEIPEDDTLRRILKSGLNVLAPTFNYSKDINTENQTILNTYHQSVNAFFMTYLKLEEHEIKELCNLKISSNVILDEEINPTVTNIKERLIK